MLLLIEKLGMQKFLHLLRIEQLPELLARLGWGN
jgi:hypothetical protein